MRATTTLGKLIEQVETMSAGNFDETVSLNDIEFASLNEMWIVVDVNDSGYRLAIRETVGLRGVRSSWAGEAVDFRRDYVQSIDQRRLSRPRTLVAVLGGALALTALFATDLFGFGGSETDALPPGGGGNGQ